MRSFIPSAALLLLVSSLIPTLTVHAAIHHVSPSGGADGDGSPERPLDLQSAFRNAGHAIKPGDTVLLHAGTYRGAFTSTLRGTAEAPIIVRGAEGERAVVDCVGVKADE